MKLGRWGVWCALHGLEREALAALAQRTERLGYAALWYPESRGYESFALGGFLLGHTERLILATGIANIYARDAVTMKQGQHSLGRLYGPRFLLGLGVSHVPSVEGLRGHTYGRPVATMSAYLDAMARAAEAAPPLPEPPTTVLAALGPRMTDLGGAKAQGIHPYNITPERTAWARERLGPGPLICSEQKVLLVTEPSRAREVAAEALAHYLALPNYRNNWRRMGYTEDDLAGRGSDRFLDAMVAWGTPEQVRARLQAHLDAGADHVCLQPLHPDGGRAPHLEALDALAP